MTVLDRTTDTVVEAILDRVHDDPTLGTADIIRITLDLAPCDACRDGEHTECSHPARTTRDGYESARVAWCCCPSMGVAA